MQRYNYFLIKILSSGKIIKTIVYYPIVETGRAPSHHRGHAPSLQLGSLNNGIFYMLRMPKTVCYLQLIFIEGE